MDGIQCIIVTRSLDVADKPRDACVRRCCAVKICPLVNDCDLLAGFSDSQSFTSGQLLAAYWPDISTFTYPSPI